MAAIIDSTGVWDYIHVVDLAKGHLRVLEKTVHKSGVDISNLGTGQGYSVLEIIAAFEKVSGRSIPYALINRRSGDVAICYAEGERSAELDCGTEN